MQEERLPVDPEKPTRKPFTAPHLIVYGDIREITRATGSGAMLDGKVVLKTGGV